jgi:uncharacterized protein (DUF1697 family)
MHLPAPSMRPAARDMPNGPFHALDARRYISDRFGLGTAGAGLSAIECELSIVKQTYVAFLRAVNVGGRTVRMDRLRGLVSDLGFSNVRTHIQSGNVFFESTSSNQDALARKIEKHLESELGFDVPTFVRSIPEIERAIALNPFKAVRVTPDIRLCIIFVSDALPKALELPARSPKGDFEILAMTRGEAFVVARLREGKMGNPSAFIEKTFGVSATARFFDTTAKILAAAKGT